MRRLLPIVMVAALAVTPAAQAKTRRCGQFAAAGGAVRRVYAIRGVTCATALRVAKQDAQSTAPAPWRCATVFSGRFAGHALAAKCGYGGGGPLLRRRHAFAVVQIAGNG